MEADKEEGAAAEGRMGIESFSSVKEEAHSALAALYKHMYAHMQG